MDDVRVYAGYVVHMGRTLAELHVGRSVHTVVDYIRRAPTAANHTATHVLNLALRKVVAVCMYVVLMTFFLLTSICHLQVLGMHANQRGSIVRTEDFRFDFDNGVAVSNDQIAVVERLVSEQIISKVFPLALICHCHAHGNRRRSSLSTLS